MRTRRDPPLLPGEGWGEGIGLGSLSPCAHLLGADAALTALLADVLGDEGVRLAGPDAAPDLVLALVGRAQALLPALQHARGTPLIVLLPFADERLQRQALELGARGCFALGQPLEALRARVRGVLRGDFGEEAAAHEEGGAA
jgi:DNA-binding NarL/FixJ family response regulator